MAKIQAQGTSGLSAYALVRNNLGQIANGSGVEAFNAGNYATYFVTLTEQGSTGYYITDFPSYLAAGLYSFVAYSYSGSPANGDQSFDRGSIDWGGAVENYVGLVVGKLPSGSISGFDPTSQTVNLGNNQTGVTIGTVNALGTSAAASVKTQIDTSIGSDAISELSGVPSSTPTLKSALMLLFMALRNKRTSDATTVKIYNASGAVIATATQSDNGTIYDKENFA